MDFWGDFQAAEDAVSPPRPPPQAPVPQPTKEASQKETAPGSWQQSQGQQQQQQKAVPPMMMSASATGPPAQAPRVPPLAAALPSSTSSSFSHPLPPFRPSAPPPPYGPSPTHPGSGTAATQHASTHLSLAALRTSPPPGASPANQPRPGSTPPPSHAPPSQHKPSTSTWGATPFGPSPPPGALPGAPSGAPPSFPRPTHPPPAGPRPGQLGTFGKLPGSFPHPGGPPPQGAPRRVSPQPQGDAPGWQMPQGDAPGTARSAAGAPQADAPGWQMPQAVPGASAWQADAPGRFSPQSQADAPATAPSAAGAPPAAAGMPGAGPSVSPPRLVPRRMSGIEVASSLDGLALLARQGSWRAIVDKVLEAYKQATGGLAQQLSFRAYHVLALMKLGMYGAAADELNLLGSLDSPQHCFEAHPGMYPGRVGSMLPFALRFLHAELPHKMGNTQLTLDRLYSLRAHCLNKAKGAKELMRMMREGALAGDQLALREVWRTWKRREEMVVYRIVTYHIHLKDYPVAVSWLQRMILRDPENPQLLAKFGFLRLQMGDVEGARAAFAIVEGLVADRTKQTQLSAAQVEAEGSRKELSEVRGMVRRNRGLMLFAEKKYEEAGREFDAALLENPTDCVATNNKALCMMYNKDLVGAVRTLEESLQMTPLTAVNETLVLNLCSMYELASTDTTETKRALSNWLTRLAPDDFDYACTRL